MRDAGARFVAARHECGATCMADGYGRVSGEVAAVSVHQGPGLTNTITGLTEAAKSRTPLLVLAADTPAAALRSNFRIDQSGLVESVGAVAEHVHGPDTAMADVARAVRRARVERRAVVLMLPLDVQAGDTELAIAGGRPGAGAGRPRSGERRPRGRAPARRGAPRDHRRPRRRARRRRARAAAPRRGHRFRARHLRGRQRPVRRRPVRGRHRRRLLVADRGAADPGGRHGDRVRRRAEPVDEPPRHAHHRRRHPGRPRRGGDRRPSPSQPRDRRRRGGDRRGAARRTRRARQPAADRGAGGGDQGGRLATRAVRGIGEARPAHAEHRARRHPPGRADRRRRLRPLHGLAVDVPARARRAGLRVPAGVPVRRPRRSATRSAPRSRGPTASPSPPSATAARSSPCPSSRRSAASSSRCSS